MFVLGASTLGEILMDVCAALSRPIEGFFDDANQEDEFLGVKILGGMDALLSNARVREAGVFVAIGDNQKRRTVCEQLKTAGFSLPRVIHPSAWVAPSARLGSGNLVLAGACIGTRTRIGAFNLIFPGVCFSHHNEVGDFNFFAPNVSIGGVHPPGVQLPYRHEQRHRTLYPGAERFSLSAVDHRSGESRLWPQTIFKRSLTITPSV